MPSLTYAEGGRLRWLLVSVFAASLAIVMSVAAIGAAIYTFFMSSDMLSTLSGRLGMALPYLMAVSGVLTLIVASRSIRVAVLARRSSAGKVAESVFKIKFNVCALVVPAMLFNTILGIVLLGGSAFAELTSRSSLLSLCLKYYDSRASAQKLDTVQTALRCCGAQSPLDWAVIFRNHTRSEAPQYTMPVPRSCCPPVEAVYDCHFSSLMDAGVMEGPIVYAYHEGCLHSAEKFLQLHYFWTSGITLLSAVLLLLVAVGQRLAQTSARAALESGDRGGRAPAWLFGAPLSNRCPPSMWNNDPPPWMKNAKKQAGDVVITAPRNWPTDRDSGNERAEEPRPRKEAEPSQAPHFFPLKQPRTTKAADFTTCDQGEQSYNPNSSADGGKKVSYGLDGLSLPKNECTTQDRLARVNVEGTDSDLTSTNNDSTKCLVDPKPNQPNVDQRPYPDYHKSGLKKNFSLSKVFRKGKDKKGSRTAVGKNLQEYEDSYRLSDLESVRVRLAQDRHSRKAPASRGTECTRREIRRVRKRSSESPSRRTSTEGYSDYDEWETLRKNRKRCERYSAADGWRTECSRSGSTCQSSRFHKPSTVARGRQTNLKKNPDKSVSLHALYAPPSPCTMSEMPTELSETPLPTSEENFIMDALRQSCQSSDSTSSCSRQSRESSPEERAGVPGSGESEKSSHNCRCPKAVFKQRTHGRRCSESVPSVREEHLITVSSKPVLCHHIFPLAPSVSTPTTTPVKLDTLAMSVMMPRKVSGLMYAVTDERMIVNVRRRSTLLRCEEPPREEAVDAASLRGTGNKQVAEREPDGRVNKNGQPNEEKCMNEPDCSANLTPLNLQVSVSKQINVTEMNICLNNPLPNGCATDQPPDSGEGMRGKSRQRPEPTPGSCVGTQRRRLVALEELYKKHGILNLLDQEKAWKQITEFATCLAIPWTNMNSSIDTGDQIENQPSQESDGGAVDDCPNVPLPPLPCKFFFVGNSQTYKASCESSQTKNCPHLENKDLNSSGCSVPLITPTIKLQWNCDPMTRPPNVSEKASQVASSCQWISRSQEGRHWKTHLTIPSAPELEKAVVPGVHGEYFKDQEKETTFNEDDKTRGPICSQRLTTGVKGTCQIGRDNTACDTDFQRTGSFYFHQHSTFRWNAQGSSNGFVDGQNLALGGDIPQKHISSEVFHLDDALSVYDTHLKGHKIPNVAEHTEETEDRYNDTASKVMPPPDTKQPCLTDRKKITVSNIDKSAFSRKSKSAAFYGQKPVPSSYSTRNFHANDGTKSPTQLLFRTDRVENMNSLLTRTSELGCSHSHMSDLLNGSSVEISKPAAAKDVIDETKLVSAKKDMFRRYFVDSSNETLVAIPKESVDMLFCAAGRPCGFTQSMCVQTKSSVDSSSADWKKSMGSSKGKILRPHSSMFLQLDVEPSCSEEDRSSFSTFASDVSPEEEGRVLQNLKRNSPLKRLLLLEIMTRPRKKEEKNAHECIGSSHDVEQEDLLKHQRATARSQSRSTVNQTKHRIKEALQKPVKLLTPLSVRQGFGKKTTSYHDLSRSRNLGRNWTAPWSHTGISARYRGKNKLNVASGIASLGFCFLNDFRVLSDVANQSEGALHSNKVSESIKTRSMSTGKLGINHRYSCRTRLAKKDHFKKRSQMEKVSNKNASPALYWKANKSNALKGSAPRSEKMPILVFQSSAIFDDASSTSEHFPQPMKGRESKLMNFFPLAKHTVSLKKSGDFEGESSRVDTNSSTCTTRFDGCSMSETQISLEELYCTNAQWMESQSVDSISVVNLSDPLVAAVRHKTPVATNREKITIEEPSSSTTPFDMSISSSNSLESWDIESAARIRRYRLLNDSNLFQDVRRKHDTKRYLEPMQDTTVPLAVSAPVIQYESMSVDNYVDQETDPHSSASVLKELLKYRSDPGSCLNAAYAEFSLDHRRAVLNELDNPLLQCRVSHGTSLHPDKPTNVHPDKPHERTENRKNLRVTVASRADNTWNYEAFPMELLPMKKNNKLSRINSARIYPERKAGIKRGRCKVLVRSYRQHGLRSNRTLKNRRPRNRKPHVCIFKAHVGRAACQPSLKNSALVGHGSKGNPLDAEHSSLSSFQERELNKRDISDVMCNLAPALLPKPNGLYTHHREVTNYGDNPKAETVTEDKKTKVLFDIRQKTESLRNVADNVKSEELNSVTSIDTESNKDSDEQIVGVLGCEEFLTTNEKSVSEDKSNFVLSRSLGKDKSSTECKTGDTEPPCSKYHICYSASPLSRKSLLVTNIYKRDSNQHELDSLTGVNDSSFASTSGSLSSYKCDQCDCSVNRGTSAEDSYNSCQYATPAKKCPYKIKCRSGKSEHRQSRLMWHTESESEASTTTSGTIGGDIKSKAPSMKEWTEFVRTSEFDRGTAIMSSALTLPSSRGSAVFINTLDPG